MAENILSDEDIREVIKIMDEAAVPEHLGLSIVAYPYETDGEAWARVRRAYYDAQYKRLFA